MEALVRQVREELFDKTQRIKVNSDDPAVINSAEIINNYRKRKFDIETERLIASEKINRPEVVENGPPDEIN